MTLIQAFMANFYQTARGWFNELSSHGEKWIMNNREHWAMGLMLGLTGPTSIFIGNEEIPAMVSVGTFLGFAAGVMKYASQNWDTVKMFGFPTGLTLLAVGLVLFRGVESWILFFRSFPIWTCLTLLASVNVTPRVIKTITALGAGVSAIIAMGIRSRTEIGREIDLEQTVVLLQEMAEVPNVAYQRTEDFGFLLGHMDHLPEAEDPHLADENTDSIELDSVSMSTRPDVRWLVQHLNQMPSQESQDTVIYPGDPMPGQSIPFPQTPENQLLEMPLIRSRSSPRSEGSSLVHMIPG